MVSIDAKDYLPFDPPPVVVPPVNTKALVGKCFDGSAICGLGPGAATADLRKAAGLTSGKVVTENGVKYIFKSVDNPFGSSAWFEKQ